MAAAHASCFQALVRVQQQRHRRSSVVQCSSSNSVDSQQQLARRSLLFAGLASFTAAGAALPAYANWDGQSAAIGSCALGESGSECRTAILLKDRAKFTYESATDNAGKVGSSPVTGVPVADLGDVYSKDTLALTDTITQFAAIADPADPARLKLVKVIKASGPQWVSKYARGGSARKLSARKVYVVVDAVQAHFATDGLAPLPRPKLAKLVADVAEARQLLSEGK